MLPHIAAARHVALPLRPALARTAFSWTSLTNRLGRFRTGASQEGNPLVEEPRPAPPPSSTPPPPPPPAKDSTALAASDERPQSIFERAKERGTQQPTPHTRWGKMDWETHEARSHHFKISPRKLNKLANQIGGGKPIDYAILQMGFSEKRAGKKVRDLLMEARDDAQRLKGMRRERMVVAEAWVGKAFVEKRRDIKGRGRAGMREHKQSRIYVRLREGKTPEQLEKERMEKALKRVKGPGYTREDVPLRNVRPMWTW